MLFSDSICQKENSLDPGYDCILWFADYNGVRILKGGETMTAYQAYMAEQIALEIKSIEDPFLLAVYTRAILYQRCRIGGAKEGTCNDCVYRSYVCRQIYEENEHELKAFEEKEENI